MLDKRHFVGGVAELGFGRLEQAMLGAGYLRARLRQRSRRVQNPGVKGKCWIWEGAMHKDGYGRMRIGQNIDYYVHRMAYAVFVGPIPAGADVHHVCHIRLCCNPRHLVLRNKVGHAVESNGKRWHSEIEDLDESPF